MSTVFKNILPIPYDTIFGTGSYVIPANKYAFFQANASLSTAPFWANSPSQYNSGAINYNPPIVQDVVSTSNTSSIQQWLVAGDSITVASNLPVYTSINTGGGYIVNYTDIYIRILVNSVAICDVRGSIHYAITTNNHYHGYKSNGAGAWSVALFDIPINNLPSELILS